MHGSPSLPDVVQEFIEEHDINVKLLFFSSGIETAEKASKASGAEPGSIVKTVIVASEQEYIAVLLPGDRMIDWSKLHSILGTRSVRLAHPSEVREITGFKPGEVSPLSNSVAGLKVVADESLFG